MEIDKLSPTKPSKQTVRETACEATFQCHFNFQHPFIILTYVSSKKKLVKKTEKQQQQSVVAFFFAFLFF